MKEYLNIYRNWCNSDYFDDQTQKELKSIADNDYEIQDRFYKDLDFGTGGLRGVLGAGTNRMNIYTVRKATQGLANFIIKEDGQDKGVAIAYDSRHMSPEFAEEAALCLNANGIRTHIFSSLRPTPVLSFAVRELGCIAGIVITASHNPPEYNGYKVYWEDGAQITYPKDKEIIEEVRLVTDYSSVKTMKRENAVTAGLYHKIKSSLDDRYIEELKKQVIHPEVIQKAAQELTIVYTPLHGTGNHPVRRILNELGFQKVLVVPEQEFPDGDFPTVAYPNPEAPEAFELALKLAEKENADLVLATDPDADRLGVYAKDLFTGNYIPFSGNMSGMLLAEYILSERKKLGLLPDNGALVKTVVTTKMAEPMAKNYGVHLIEVLTGFKYIGEQIKLFDREHTYQYIFGLEESYGCLVGTHARDKDAVGAVMMLCEAAAFCKIQGITLWDYMQQIYAKYGYFREGLSSLTMKGIDGVQKIKNIMDKLRSNPPEKFGKWDILAVRDYENGIRKDVTTGKISPTGLPKSNVLYFELVRDAWCCVRPSGTEPKIKFYMGVKADTLEEAVSDLEQLQDNVLEKVQC